MNICKKSEANGTEPPGLTQNRYKMDTDDKNISEKTGLTGDGASSQSTAVEETQAPLLEYACHPAKRDMRITVLASVFIVVCVILVWLISFSPLLTAVAVLILVGSLTGFYFPTRYYFYNDHLIVKTTLQALRKEWSQYRSYYPDKHGVLLSPFARPTRLENFRGLYIKFAGNRDKVMEIVRSKIKFEDGV